MKMKKLTKNLPQYFLFYLKQQQKQQQRQYVNEPLLFTLHSLKIYIFKGIQKKTPIKKFGIISFKIIINNNKIAHI